MSLLLGLNNFHNAVKAKIATLKANININGNSTLPGCVRRAIFQGSLYTAINPGVSGGDIPVANLGTNTNVYLHFKLPLKTTLHSEMFYFNIRGYCYGTAQTLNETLAGYSYVPENALLSIAVAGNFSPAIYRDTSGNVVLRLLMPSVYYTTLQIDTMSVGNGRLFNKGDLVCVPSLSSTINFG